MRIETINIPAFEDKKISLPDPEFVTYQPDFKAIDEAWKEFGWYRNFIVIGHGGSVTALMAMHGALGKPDKNVEFLSTVDPDYIAALHAKYRKSDTLVMAISKSGETVTQIEALMRFSDYPLLFIAGVGSALETLGAKLGAKVYKHPPIGGRYTAFTEVALLPARIIGLDAAAIHHGGQRIFAEYKHENLASKLAQIMYQLEQRGYVDVFMPFYSHALYPSANLVIQLAHESFGKNGTGQTYFASEAPESQHHTNQRFFGGRKNIAGLFIVQEHFAHQDELTKIPTVAHSIHIRDGSLVELNNIPLSFAMRAEFEGTWENAKVQMIPCVAVHATSADAGEVGAFLAHWLLFAVYSSLLRDVDPFDQPQVESSKVISWRKRTALRRG